MTDPASATIGSFLGIKWAAVIAGALGSVIALRYIEDLTTFGRILAVLTGMALAAYGSVAVAQIFGLSRPVENAVAFVFGLTAMNIVPGFMRLSEQFASDPLKFLRATHDRRREDPHD